MWYIGHKRTANGPAVSKEQYADPSTVADILYDVRDARKPKHFEVAGWIGKGQPRVHTVACFLNMFIVLSSTFT